MITSPHNERIKLARALLTSAKARRKEDLVALEGLRLLRDALERGFHPAFILFDPERVENADLPPVGDVPVLAVAPQIMRDLSDTETPPGVISIFPTPSAPLPPQPRQVLILDNIRDPGNLGTILRTAAAAGVEGVLLSPGCADAYNPKTLRAGMGAHFRIPALEASWTRIAVYCRPLTVLLADMDGDAAYDAVDWTGRWALIIGSEAHGASPEAETLASRRVYIPMHAATESLNAAAAAAVILFEAARQNRHTGGGT